MSKLINYTDKLSALMPFSLPCTSKTINQRVLELPNNLILSPPIPIGIFLQEAYDIFRFIQDDKGLFLAKNCNWEIVEELPARIDFLRDAEATWWTARFRPSPAVTEFRQLQARADDVCKKLIKDIAYACADDAGILKSLGAIRKLSHENEYVSKINDICCLAQNVAGRLMSVGSDPQLIATLEQCAGKLPEAYAKYVIDASDECELRSRDRAYTFCAVAVEAIRRCARYALDCDRKKLLGYTSEYFRKSNSRSPD